MARSRRKYRRSTSQSAASLLALALPAPLQRVAGSPAGPLMMFFGLPAMLIVGLLQVDWEHGTPQVKVNSQKVSEFREVVKGQISNLENQQVFQQWQNTARDVWNAQQPSVPQQQNPQPQYPQQYSPQQQYPLQQYPNQANPQATGNQSAGWGGAAPSWNDGPRNDAVVGNARAPFPSTNPPASQYVSTQASANPQSNNGYAQQQSSGWQPSYQQPQYAQPQYAEPQQQPAYSQQQYWQQQQAYGQ